MEKLNYKSQRKWIERKTIIIIIRHEEYKNWIYYWKGNISKNFELNIMESKLELDIFSLAGSWWLAKELK